jgi:chorismate-pyruvate lyase
VARKHVSKKLKVMETTSQEVSSLSRVVEYLFRDVVYADDEIPLLAGDSAFRPR